MSDRLDVLWRLARSAAALLIGVLALPPLLVACAAAFLLLVSVGAADGLSRAARRLQN